jgi:rhodanese-related sulfurtransferase
MKRLPALLLALLALVALPLAACGSDDDGATADGEASAEVPAPGREAAAVALEEGRTIIDVRTPEEFDEGHIAGAERIGLADPDFADRIAELDPDGAYVVYCRSGNRSATAVAEMRDLGLDVLDGGGLPDMEAAGYEQGT